jgi:hypothetical protein
MEKLILYVFVSFIFLLDTFKSKEVTPIPDKNDCGTTGIDGEFSPTALPLSAKVCTDDLEKKCCFISFTSSKQKYYCIKAGQDYLVTKEKAEKLLNDTYEIENINSVDCGYDKIPKLNECGSNNSTTLINTHVNPKYTTSCTASSKPYSRCCYIDKQHGADGPVCLLEKSQYNPGDAEYLYTLKYGDNIRMVDCGSSYKEYPPRNMCGKKPKEMKKVGSAFDDKTQCQDTSQTCCYLLVHDHTSQSDNAVCMYEQISPPDKTTTDEMESLIKDLYDVQEIKCYDPVSSSSASGIKMTVITLLIISLII